MICYRTLEERAKRLFSTKGVPMAALDPALFARSKHMQVKPTIGTSDSGLVPPPSPPLPFSLPLTGQV